MSNPGVKLWKPSALQGKFQKLPALRTEKNMEFVNKNLKIFEEI